MKTLITAAAIAVLIATPGLAEKTPVKPIDKPAYAECNSQIALLQAQIKQLKKEIAILSQAETSKPKPTNRLKKA